jgi:peptide/nickel transport system permease protein
LPIDPATSPASTADDAFAATAAGERHEVAPGAGPWRVALRRLRRDRVALAFGALFLLIVVISLFAPLWAHQVAHTSASANHLSDRITVDGKPTYVVSPPSSANPGIPIGPTYGSKFFLGADASGRDVMVRLLYGARTSFEIGFAASALTLLLSIVLGLLSGYLRGWVDALISRALDVVWAYPVVLLGVALGTSLAIKGVKLGPIELESGSLLVPIFIIGLVYVPYMARPLRGRVLSLREKEFVDAARAQGSGPVRIMLSELLPNLATDLIVFFPLIVANAVLLESALSFLGAGVQPPTPSLGTMIADGNHNIFNAVHLVIVPGLVLVLAVLALNVFGDGVRDALDPRSRVRIEH